ncbi:Pathogenesis-related protein PRB1-3 [Linum perenne]
MVASYAQSYAIQRSAGECELVHSGGPYGENLACGHYTQVVWRRTTTIGCAKAACSSGYGTFVVCSYSPRGNIIGQKPY